MSTIVTFTGIEEGDSLGRGVSSAGDVNGDGIDDLFLGAPFADVGDTLNPGESYVIFGTTAGFSLTFDLSTLDGTNGFVIQHTGAFDEGGQDLSAAGDVNGDGIDDLIIGAELADANDVAETGEAFVVFGSTAGFSASLDLGALDGSNGFVIEGIDTGDRAGSSVAGVGDVNGDGTDDVVVGARFADLGGSASGESYVIFGTTAGFSATFDPAELDGSNGFVIVGADAQDTSGYSVSGAGDINGDGIADLIIGARYADPGGDSYAGTSYVVFGSSAGFSATLDLGALDGSNGFALEGVDPEDRSGQAVADAGDVNGDGIDDLIVGAYLADPGEVDRAGETYVVFGTSAGFSATLDLGALDGTNGFVLEGEEDGDLSGWAVDGAGDVNGDGIDDIIIGARSADGSAGVDSGKSYLVFGSSAGFSATIDLGALDGSDGYILEGVDGDDYSGRSVSGAGDVNGDGVDDVVIGASGASSRAGEAYLVLGGEDSLAELDAADGDVDGRIDLATVCFTAGTRVLTPAGERVIETLRPGDLVLTVDRGPQPVRWIGTRHFSASDLALNPALAPVCIPAHAYGPGCPARDLLVSQMHRLLTGGGRAKALLGVGEVLIPAAVLGHAPATGAVTYVHLLFDRHEILTTEGLRSESFHPSAQGLGDVTARQRTELLTVFPDLATSPGWAPPARPLPTKAELSLLFET